MLEKILINTSLGRSVLNLEDNVYSDVGEGFLEKQIIDVNIGESILYQKEYVAKSLNEVEPYLRMSERYNLAEEMLHESSSFGGRIPKLRAKLIEGAAQRGLINEENLENKIFLNQGDISSESYRIIREEVMNHLQEMSMQISDSAVDSWIRGRVVSPREWSMYRALSNINPEFIEFNELNKSRESYFFNYKLYTVIRQGIMRWLSNPRHAPPVNSHEPGDSLDISLDQEIGLVFNHFAREIDNKYLVAQVLEMQRLPENSRLFKKSKKEPRLRKGVVTGYVPEIRDMKKDVGEIITKERILENAFNEIIEKTSGDRIRGYIDSISTERIKTKSENIFKQEKERLSKQLGNHYLTSFVIQDLKKRAIESSEKTYEKLIKPSAIRLFTTKMINNYVSVRGEPKYKNFFTFFLREISDVDFGEVRSQFNNDLYSGEVDKMIDAPFGTTLRVLDILKRNHRNIPKSVLDYQEGMEKMIPLMTQIKGFEMSGADSSDFKKRLQKLEKKQNKLKKYIKSKYPYFKYKDTNIDLRGEYTSDQANDFFDAQGFSALKKLNLKNFGGDFMKGIN
tara:strand:+ start:1249 stop:2946 length:1698 start_codon:yes stop_codon:yes gene_type:complete